MSASVAAALWVSVQVATACTLLALPVAIVCGRYLARSRFRYKPLIETLLFLPLVLPPVVVGYGLLEIFGQGGPLSTLWTASGVHLPFTRAAAVLAAFVVGLPLFIMTTRTAFAAVDERYEALAATLGLSRRRVFFRVSLPLALPGVLAGAVLCFARALGEFGATAVLAGNSEGDTRTLALAVYALLDAPDADVAPFVWTSVLLALVCLAGYEGFSRWHRAR